MTYLQNENRISSTAFNSRAAATLAAGATFQGVGEDVSGYGRVGVAITSDNATDGTLTMEVSHDGVTWGGPTRTWSDTRSAQPHMWNIVEKYFRIKYVNGSTEAINLSIQVQYSNNADVILGHQLDETLLTETEATVTRSILMGKTEGNKYVNVPVSSYGRLQLDLPLTAFGELSVAEKTPQVQVKFPAGLNSGTIQSLTNKSGSTVTATDGLCTLTCSSTAESFCQVRSVDVIRYGPGQGMNARLTASFTAGVALSSQWAGPGDDDEMIGFGYDGTSFGILHRSFGEQEIRSITFTAGGDAGGGTFVLTIDSTAVVITVPSGSATIADVCALVVEAAADIFNAGRGWEVRTPDSKTVIFTSLVAENASGTFSFVDVDSGVTAGAFTQGVTLLAGVTPEEVVIPQASWNVDVMDGTGVSGMILDPTKLNVFDFKFQYLGAGNIFLSVENPTTGQLEPVHMIQNANMITVPTFRQPTFHINLIAKTESGYSGSALVMTTASLAGFIEGKEANFGIRHATSSTVSTNSTTEVVNLVIHNEQYYNGTRNKVEMYMDFVSIINEATKPIRVDIYLNPTHINSGITLTAVGSDSIATAGAGTGTRTGGQLILTTSVPLSSSKELDLEPFRIKMHPSDRMVFVVTKLSGGADGNVVISPSWVERV